jgi:SAM-dependent methyltransferase
VKSNLQTPEQFSEAYDGRTPEWYADLLSDVTLLGKPGPILDLGAGLGLFAELAHAWGADVIGVEGSGYAVARARSRRPGLRIVEHNLDERLPFEDGSFANVMLHQVVEHLERETYLRVLSECQRVLSSGGTLFIHSPSRWNLRERGEEGHINLLLPSELVRDLEAAGFVVVCHRDGGFWFAPHAHNYRFAGIAFRALIKFVPRNLASATASAIARKAQGSLSYMPH